MYVQVIRVNEVAFAKRELREWKTPLSLMLSLSVTSIKCDQNEQDGESIPNSNGMQVVRCAAIFDTLIIVKSGIQIRC